MSPRWAAAVALALGAFLDGIPEQMVLGIGLAGGDEVSIGLLAAIFVSNLPEGAGGATELKAAGRSASRSGLWLAVVRGVRLATPLATRSIDITARRRQGEINGLAAGALLVMLVDSMIPDATEQAGRTTGLVTALESPWRRAVVRLNMSRIHSTLLSRRRGWGSFQSRVVSESIATVIARISAASSPAATSTP